MPPSHPIPPRGLGLPPLNPIPSLDSGIAGPSFARFGVPQRGFGYAGFYPLPVFGADYSFASPPVQNFIVIQQPAPPVGLQETPRPSARAEIREYKLAGAPEPAPAREPPVFTIVLKDGSTRSAVASTVQDDGLLYVDPEGRHERISSDAIDYEATRRDNRSRQLDL